MHTIAIIIQYYFLGVILTTITASWIFIDVASAIYEPSLIIEDLMIGLLMGFIWPVVVPGYIIYRGTKVCQRLFFEEK